MHISVLWKLPRNSIHLIHVTPQLLKRFLEFFKNYFLSQFMSFTRKSVLLLYNYTLFFFEVVLSSLITTWFTTLGSKLTWLLPEIKATLKKWRRAIVENVPQALKAISKEGSNPRCPPPPLPHSELKSSFSKTTLGRCCRRGPAHLLRPKRLRKRGVYTRPPTFSSLPLGWPRCSRAQGSSPLPGTCHQLSLFFLFNSSNILLSVPRTPLFLRSFPPQTVELFAVRHALSPLQAACSQGAPVHSGGWQRPASTWMMAAAWLRATRQARVSFCLLDTPFSTPHWLITTFHSPCPIQAFALAL